MKIIVRCEDEKDEVFKMNKHSKFIIEASIYGDCLFGFNFYIQNFFIRRFIETFDTIEEAVQIFSEIKRAFKHGDKQYVMPEGSVLDDEDIFEMLK